jgi:hypothetical protein
VSVETKPENPPAFPRVFDTGRGELERVYAGLSMRDYFAAHAPRKPQAWFKPRLSAEWSKRPDIPTGLHPDSQRCVESWLDDPIWDLERDLESDTGNGACAPRDFAALRVFVAAVRAHWAHNDALRKEEAIERLKQWPYAWADAMLQERSKP